MSGVAQVAAVASTTERERVLNNVHRFVGRFIAYPSPESQIAHALWIAHTHAADVFENTPRIAFLSPEPGSGKSRALELTEALVPRPVLSVNASTAYIFRKISDEAGLPTLLLDEVDAIFTGKGENEDLRGLLNSGYRAGATAGRAAVRGKEIVTEEWPSFCPVALAGLNTLPDTLMTRSVIVAMKRRRRDQKVEPFRRRVNGPEAEDLKTSLATEFGDEFIREEFRSAWPELPEGIEDRDADVWEPLIAVADAAGGRWPTIAREAAVKLVTDAKRRPVTLGIKLLSDIRQVFIGDERLASSEILGRLHDLEGSPWGNLKGEPIDARFLASQLKKYEVESRQLKIDGRNLHGYVRGDFLDAWDRYVPIVEEKLPPLPPLPLSIETPDPGYCRGCGGLLPCHKSHSALEQLRFEVSA